MIYFFQAFSIALLSLLQLHAWDGQDVDFDASMQRSYSYNPTLMHHDPRWNLARRLWQEYQRSARYTSSEYIIPPIIHFIWLGSPLPPRCRDMIQTWCRHHPTWQVRLWTGADVEGFGMQNRAAFDKARNYGEKADIWRYEILLRYGGLYADTDFECLKSFDQIHKSCRFYAGLGYRPDPLLYNGLIGAVPGHPIMKLCVESIRVGSGNHNDWRIQASTGPDFFTNCFFQCAGKCKGVVAFPVTFFYPFPNSARALRGNCAAVRRRWALPESYAIHYWEWSWQQPQNKR